MPDQTVGTRLTADSSGFVGEVKSAEENLLRLAGATDRASRAAGRQSNATSRMTKGMAAAASVGRRMERGMSAAGRATLEQASAARSAAAANQGLTSRFGAAHGSMVRYTLAATAGAIAIGEVYAQLRRLPGALRETVDNYTRLNNALRLVTRSEAGLVGTRQRLLAISRDTRTSLDANAQLYRRIALSAEATGHSQAQLLRVTELLNKQVLIGGNNAEEAAAGLVQFAQGLASGRLQGDELRSVMENLLGVQQGLIEGFATLRQRGQIDFDVTRANIRDLAAEGVLSADLLIDAVLASGDITEERFRNVDITISDALTNLGTGLGALTGRLNEITGIGRALAGVFNSLAAAAADAAETDFDELTTELNSLRNDLERWPAWIRRLFGDNVQARIDAIQERRQEIRAAATGDVVSPAERSRRAAEANASRSPALEGLDIRLQAIFKAGQSEEEARREQYRANLRAIKEGGAALDAALEEEGRTRRDLVLAQQQALHEDLARLREQPRSAAGRQAAERDIFPEARGDEFELYYSERAFEAAARQQEQLRRQEMAHLAEMERLRRQAAQAERRRQVELARDERERRAREYADRLAQAQGFADAAVQQQALREEAIIALRYRSVQEVARIVALANRLQYQEGVQAIQTGLELAKQGFQALAEQSRTAFRLYKAAAIAQTIISTYQGAQDAYASGLKVPAPAPIPQIIAVAAAAAAVAAGIGRVNAIRSQRQPQAFARGGVVDSPTYFSGRNVPFGVAGEAGPEAILPLRRGPGGRLGVQATGAGMRPVVINNNVTVGDINVEGGDDPDRIGRDIGDALVRRTRTEMRRVIADEQRPGGLLNRTEQVA